MNTTTPTAWKTTEAYIYGGICGHLWMPAVKAGKTHRVNLRGPFGAMDRFGERASFADVLDSVLANNGGDFQDARFTADTEIVVIRKRYVQGGYQVHVKRIEVSRIDPDLVDADAYTGDFFGDED